MPANHYYGLRTGPNESHGGYYAPERPDVKAIQTRLAALGHACPTDGNYGPTTKAAVTAWQRKRYAAQTSRYGEVWRDDWVRLFTY
ncbi:MAG: peptidoglycan-binding protein [Acidobacteria bacterium]|nr:MAG: peptidoglycan-binding protein [Acidobacteriota bacterium]